MTHNQAAALIRKTFRIRKDRNYKPWVDHLIYWASEWMSGREVWKYLRAVKTVEEFERTHSAVSNGNRDFTTSGRTSFRIPNKSNPPRSMR